MERSAAKPLVIDDQEQGLFRVNRRTMWRHWRTAREALPTGRWNGQTSLGE